MKIIITFVAILFFIGCGGISYNHRLSDPHFSLSDIAEIASQDTVITLERRPCHGSCPVYTLLVLGNGSVFYHGRIYVETKGIYITKVDQKVISDLILAFETADYFSLDDDLGGCALGSAAVFTSIKLGEKYRKIYHDHACKGIATSQLTALEETIDSILNTEQWIEENMNLWIK